jgi:hypothetical protein
VVLGVYRKDCWKVEEKARRSIAKKNETKAENETVASDSTSAENETVGSDTSAENETTLLKTRETKRKKLLPARMKQSQRQETSCRFNITRDSTIVIFLSLRIC